MMPGEETVLSFDGETIRVSCVGKAHSLSDSIVFFEERKLLMAGDLVWENMHPVLIGSDVTSWRRVLNTLEKGCLAEVIVPGHGNITDMKAITKMAGYFDSIAAAVGDPDRMVGLKRQYNSYYQFPLFSGVGAVARLIKRETARSHRNSNSRLGLSK